MHYHHNSFLSQWKLNHSRLNYLIIQKSSFQTNNGLKFILNYHISKDEKIKLAPETSKTKGLISCKI